jgi:phosphoglycerate dehydrogenase-like enzyme
MQILMSEAAHGRVRNPLADLQLDLDVVTVDGDGALKRDNALVGAASVDPEVVWVSLDTFKSGQLAHLFGKLLTGTRVKWTQIFAAGVDNPAFKAVMAKGIRLTKSSAQGPSIAEYVIAHAFNLLHPIEAQRKAQTAHAWTQIDFREIASTRWLMVGFGSIGYEIARRLQPFNAQLTVVRRNAGQDPLAAEVISTSDLLSRLPQADVVILACALTEETKGLANDAFFQAMKAGSLFINIARGGLVDEAALKAGLEQDKPARAVLDVFETEPLPDTSWLWGHPKVSVTAHGSNAGDGVLARGDKLFLENLSRYSRGEVLLHEATRSEVGL